jgi:hypothetical protein
MVRGNEIIVSTGDSFVPIASVPIRLSLKFRGIDALCAVAPVPLGCGRLKRGPS